jgi:hypothetical protein
VPTHHVFDRLLDKSRSRPKLPVAVVAPTTEVALTGALEAAREGLICTTPWLPC